MSKKIFNPIFWYESFLVKKAKFFGKVKEIPVSKLFIGVEEPFEIARPFVFKNGGEKRKLRESPHYLFLKAFVEGGDLEKTDYFLWKKAAHGYKAAQVKIKEFIDLFRETKMLKQKDSCKKFLKPVLVFKDVVDWKGPRLTRKRPLTKRGGYEPKNFEIFDGHHRAAILAFLGRKKIACLMISSFHFWE